MEDVKRVVGVVGAGVMGAGVCEDLLQHGYAPILIDVDRAALDAAATRIRRSLSARALFAKAEMREPVDAILARLHRSTEYQAVADADLVVENVNEVIELKCDVYEALCDVVSPSCILVANTSCIPITRLGASTRAPGRLIGVHFMNPVPLKDTVEVIPGELTSPDTVRATERFLDDLGKKYVVVRDSPGFVSNRVLMLTINEAICLVHEGVADAEDVDAIFKSCFDHGMGPLATADLIGLDTVRDSLRVLETCFGAEKYQPCPLLEKMINEGHLGRKSGRGFFRY